MFALYTVYYKSNQLDENKIILNIDSPESVEPGREFDVKLSVANNNKVVIDRAYLEFEFEKSTNSGGVANVDKREYTYQNLGLSMTKVENISNIKVYGRNGDNVTLHAKLIYQIAGNNAQFVKSLNKDIKILPRQITLSVNGPKDIDGGVAFTYKVIVKNDSDRDMGKSRVVFAFPAEYNTISASSPLNDRNEWEIDSIKKGDTLENSIIATQGGINGEQKAIRVKLEELVNDDLGAIINDNDYQYSLIYLPLSVSADLKVNHSITHNIYVGQQGTLGIYWENTLNESISNLSFNVILDGTSTLIDKSTFPALSDIPAGDKSMIEIPIIGKAEADGYMHLSITANGDRLQSTVTNTKIGSTDFLIKVRN